MFIIAHRFIPTLQIEGKRIHEAQLARGYHPGDGFVGRIKSVAPVMVPLVSNPLSRVTLLGLTIDLRGIPNACPGSGSGNAPSGSLTRWPSR
jgi:energy-coupling factor transport system permease protein